MSGLLVSAPHRWGRVAIVLAASLGLAALARCSLLVDKNATQCQTDDDCAKFGHASCQMPAGVCAPWSVIDAVPIVEEDDGTADGSAESESDANDEGDTLPDDDAATIDAPADGDGGKPEGEAGACSGPSGCYACKPAADREFLNACTASQCVPFDNASRLKNLTADGGLKPLP